MAESHPDAAKQLLMANPQLARALLQININFTLMQAGVPQGAPPPNVAMPPPGMAAPGMPTCAAASLMCVVINDRSSVTGARLGWKLRRKPGRL